MYPHSEENINIVVPDGASAGDTIAIQVNDQTIQYKLPPGAKAGDTITLSQEQNVVDYIVKDGAKPGDVVEIPVGDKGEVIKYTLPPGAKPGHSITIGDKVSGDGDDEEVGMTGGASESIFRVPKDAQPGNQYRVGSNDESGRFQIVTIPEGVKPGDLLELEPPPTVANPLDALN